MLEIHPNCGGDFIERPKRPASLLIKYPVSSLLVYKPVDKEAHIKKWKIS